MIGQILWATAILITAISESKEFTIFLLCNIRNMLNPHLNKKIK